MIINLKASFYDDQVPDKYIHRATSVRADIEDFLEDTLKIKVNSIENLWDDNEWCAYCEIDIEDTLRAQLFKLRYSEYILC